MDFPYIQSSTFLHYLKTLYKHYPNIYQLLDFDTLLNIDIEKYYNALDKKSWEFESTEQNGRGQNYNEEKKDLEGRGCGIETLLRLFVPTEDRLPPSHWKILDVLAGNGTITRYLKKFTSHPCQIISADISKYMINAAFLNNFSCIRQPADKSFFIDSCLDGVLIAYGSHHLNDEDRDKALAEAYRTLKSDHRVILHDFEEGTPMTAWFHKIVHPYSKTGHPHPHYSKEELVERFSKAGFSKVKVMTIEDPFRLTDKTAEAAKRRLLRHLFNMYGLIKFYEKFKKQWEIELENVINDIFGGITVTLTNEGYQAELSRNAIVGIGTKKIK